MEKCMNKRRLRYIIKRITLFFGVLCTITLIQACGRELPHEESCNFVQNANLQRVSWDQNVPVNLYLDSSVPAEYVAAVEAAVTRWNVVGQRIRQQDFFDLRHE